MRRVIIIVMDGVGIGPALDSDKYGDGNANTLGHVAKSKEGYKLPNLQRWGIGKIQEVNALEDEGAVASYGSMYEKSAGKDTITGHWEMMGVVLEKPFPTYPNGFPKEIMDKFEQEIGTKSIGNYPASGTVIINELGDEHVATGYPIVYTSGDSVFQIAAHEEVIPVEKLYEMCRKARNILVGEHAVGRVIARPFVGESGNYTRTSNRRDFAISPLKRTVLDACIDKGYEVKAVGKIEDIFNKRGITEAVHTKNNMDGVDKTIEFLKQDFDGVIFTNLVDFDMLYGHRNNTDGFAKALSDLDNRIEEIEANLKDDDIVIITADHGCDPTVEGTDHTRERVPLLVYNKRVAKGHDLQKRWGFIDIAETISEFFDLGETFGGKSFLKDVYPSED